MRVLIAPDKFKGSLEAASVGDCIADGIREVWPEADLDVCPVADGGEGTARIIIEAQQGEWVTCLTHDPLMREIEASYGWIESTKAAVIETSEAIGLHRLQIEERAPLQLTTFGIGEMMTDAIERRARGIILGLGGSATNDGGFGMARGLGFRFFAGERELVGGPAELVTLTRFEVPRVALGEMQITAATDVQAPLLGPHGATRAFSAQKGASARDQEMLERALTCLADVIAKQDGTDHRNHPGTGAAGGLGFGLMSFCHAQMKSGFDLVAQVLNLRERIEQADCVITGEGRLDLQTLQGKAAAGVAGLARAGGKKICAIVGEVGEGAGQAQLLFDEIKVLATPPISRTVAIRHCGELLRERAVELAKSWACQR